MLCESVSMQAGGRDDDCDGADTTVCAIQDDKPVRTCELYMQVRVSAAWAWLAWLHHTVGAPGALANRRAECRSCFPSFLALASIVEVAVPVLGGPPLPRTRPATDAPTRHQPVAASCLRATSLSPATDQPRLLVSPII
jgi:hypothetical protein